MQPPLREAIAIAIVLVSTRPARADVVMTASPSDLVDGPVGIETCDDTLTLSFAGATQTLDVWWADEGVPCGVAAERQSGACHAVGIGEDALAAEDGVITLTTSAGELFGDLAAPCDGTSETRTFWFFDAEASGDVVTEYPEGAAASLPLVLDTIAPSAPEMEGDAAGDTAITVGWIAPSDLPAPSAVRIYVDPNQCANDLAPRPGSVTATAGYFVVETDASTPGTTTLDTATLGWSATHNGQRGALGMTVLDEAGNESAISELVCIYHARCTGDGGTTPDCAPQGFCSVPAPGAGARTTPGIAVLAVLGGLIARHLSRRGSAPRERGRRPVVVHPLAQERLHRGTFDDDVGRAPTAS